MRKISLLVAGAALVTLGAALPGDAASSRNTAEPSTVTVYHSPTCGCCKKWVEHLESSGFTVKSIEQEDLSDIKVKFGVVPKLRSCHTAVVAGYVIEGHVPSDDIKRLLAQKPRIAGLSAPGMPQSAPGMDLGRDPYDVLTFDAKGATTVWARH